MKPRPSCNLAYRREIMVNRTVEWHRHSRMLIMQHFRSVGTGQLAVWVPRSHCVYLSACAADPIASFVTKTFFKMSGRARESHKTLCEALFAV